MCTKFKKCGKINLMKIYIVLKTEWACIKLSIFFFFFLAELSQENIVPSQPQRQTPPVQQQSQIPQNMYNGQSQGTMNQHNPYSGGQIPPQGLHH